MSAEKPMRAETARPLTAAEAEKIRAQYRSGGGASE
jgi:hypothetical protein